MPHVHAFSCIRTFNSIYLDIQLLGTFFIVSLSFLLSLPLTLVASWHLSISPLRPRTFFIPRHLLFLLIMTPHPLTSDSAMRRLKRTSLRTFHDAAFIQNAKSFFQIFLTLTCPLSSTVSVRSHYVVPRSHALP